MSSFPGPSRLNLNNPQYLDYFQQFGLNFPSTSRHSSELETQDFFDRFDGNSRATNNIASNPTRTINGETNTAHTERVTNKTIIRRLPKIDSKLTQSPSTNQKPIPELHSINRQDSLNQAVGLTSNSELMRLLLEQQQLETSISNERYLATDCNSTAVQGLSERYLIHNKYSSKANSSNKNNESIPSGLDKPNYKQSYFMDGRHIKTETAVSGGAKNYVLCLTCKKVFGNREIAKSHVQNEHHSLECLIEATIDSAFADTEDQSNLVNDGSNEIYITSKNNERSTKSTAKIDLIQNHKSKDTDLSECVVVIDSESDSSYSDYQIKDKDLQMRMNNKKTKEQRRRRDLVPDTSDSDTSCEKQNPERILRKNHGATRDRDKNKSESSSHEYRKEINKILQYIQSGSDLEKTIASKGLLKLVSKIKSKPKLYKCICDLHFLKKSDLYQHIDHDQHHTSKSKFCNICKRKFAKSNFKSHVKKHHLKLNLRRKDFELVTAESTRFQDFENDQNDIQEASTSKDDFDKKKMPVQTVKPSEVLDEDDTLDVENTNDTNTKLFKCSICDIHFLHYKTFKIHLQQKKHEMKTRTRCEHCRLYFTKLSLRKHKAIHHQTQKLSAGDFQIVESSDPNMSVHIYYEKRAKLYRCEKCDIQFLHRTTWRGHLRNNLHKMQTKSCTYCSLKFSGKSLTKHIKEHHEEQNLCLEEFEIVSSLDFPHLSGGKQNIDKTKRRNITNADLIRKNTGDKTIFMNDNQQDPQDVIHEALFESSITNTQAIDVEESINNNIIERPKSDMSCMSFETSESKEVPESLTSNESITPLKYCKVVLTNISPANQTLQPDTYLTQNGKASTSSRLNSGIDSILKDRPEQSNNNFMEVDKYTEQVDSMVNFRDTTLRTPDSDTSTFILEDVYDNSMMTPSETNGVIENNFLDRDSDLVHLDMLDRNTICTELDNSGFEVTNRDEPNVFLGAHLNDNLPKQPRLVSSKANEEIYRDYNANNNVTPYYSTAAAIMNMLRISLRYPEHRQENTVDDDEMSKDGANEMKNDAFKRRF